MFKLTPQKFIPVALTLTSVLALAGRLALPAAVGIFGSTLTGCAVARAAGPVFDPKMYGAKGDGTTNDTVAIQAAVTAAQAVSGRVVFTPGTYIVHAPITLGSNPIVVEGSTFNDTVVKAGTAMASVFSFTDAAQNNRFGFKNIHVNGNHLAQCGIKSEKIAHTLFERVKVTGTNTAGISIGFGWDNDILECEVSFNNGDGILLSVNNNNAVNIKNTKIFSNVGCGIKSLGGARVNIVGNTIEMNQAAGIYLMRSGDGVSIRDNYFESNAATGISFTVPSAITIKAPIIVNGSATEGELRWAFPQRAVEINSNFATISSGNDAFVWLGAVIGARVSNNRSSSYGATVPLTAVYGDSSYCTAQDVVLENNSNFSKDVSIVGLVAGKRIDLSGWKSNTARKTNYFPESSFKWTPLLTGGGGTIAKGTTKYNGFETVDITGATNTDGWGLNINVSQYPELAGKAVYLAAKTQVSAATNGAVLNVYNSAEGPSTWISSTSSYAADTTWISQAQTFTMPTSGNVYVVFRKIGASASDTLRISMPTLAMVGAPVYDFYTGVTKPDWATTAAPTTGTWEVGDYVRNSAPSAGSAIGWRCVAAGTPGTWEALQYMDLTGTQTIAGIKTFSSAPVMSGASITALNATQLTTGAVPDARLSSNIPRKDTANTFTGTQAVSAGDLTIASAGYGFRVKEGSNATMGTATLVAGSTVVTTTKVTATSRIILTVQDPNGTVAPGTLWVSARTPGTSFTITSNNTAETSIVAWVIFEPAP